MSFNKCGLSQNGFISGFKVYCDLNVKIVCIDLRLQTYVVLDFLFRLTRVSFIAKIEILIL